MKLGNFSYNLSGINILIFFFSKFGLVLAVGTLFQDQVLFILNMFSWENEYVFDNISHICV